MTRYELRNLSRAELEALFRERKAALIEVRDEIDRRDKDVPKDISVDFEQYITK